MIIWLASYPRSGNSLARLALFSLFGLRSGSVYPETGLVRRPLQSLVDTRPLELLDALEGPVFVKTHDLRHAGDDRPAVVVVRDGRDALVSYAHFIREERGDSSEFEALLRSVVCGRGGAMGTWSESAEAWRRRSAPTAFVRYEDLRADPARALARAGEAAGVRLGRPRGEIRDFQGLHRIQPSFFRSGQAGSWRSEMPADVEDLFWSRHGATMEALGYER